jgi:hypothetical protein
MHETLEAIFDGSVFRPETTPKLPPNTRCTITVEDIADEDQEEDAWSVLEAMAGTVEAPKDWASEHDHFLYNSPLRTAHNM